ncbi:lysozyme [Dyella sp. SG562]|uniref:lysozyme n=1 Tax=Dyella sp. SG562 TaxID=2587017 RepID=UPI00141F10C4|nr:lysozyme [Dyella sp. SG562]NII73244.1 lysozyme [Dyella sp. SG562]
MLPSQQAVNLVKSFEGCSLTAYTDSVGVLTIGYGHTGGVRPGQTISQDQADAFLVNDLATASAAVAQRVEVPLNQNQFDALTSFVFNVGGGAFHDSTMLRLINQRNFEGAAAEFERWRYAGGRVLPGLLRRRIAERTLFLRQA